MIKAGFDKPLDAAAHHIVAGLSPRAAEAREILDSFSININDAANGVWLPGMTKSANPGGSLIHSTLHTTDYYKYVNDRLRQAATKDEALQILDKLRTDLLSGKAPW